jgi:hypothetical protein
MATLRDDVGKRIEERLSKLKTRVAHRKLISDFQFPMKTRRVNTQIVESYLEELKVKIAELEPLIKSLRRHIDYIGDNDVLVAAYLLIGKSLFSLKAIMLLAREGYSFQIVELTRSSIESLELSMFLLEDSQKDSADKWFKGEIISNRRVRQVIDEIINKTKGSLESKNIPFGKAIKDTYDIYSSFTHSGYSALFDYIDVFKEDFDFDQTSQLHYNRKNIHAIENLYVNILLALENYFIRANDEENFKRIELLLSKEGNMFASKEEISREFDRYLE